MRRAAPARTAAILSAALCLLLPGAARGQEKEPVYVGVRVCGSCHQGEASGHQFSRWLLSQHARAYAALSKPEAWAMAELSGVPGEPQESPMCLGCHATAADAEPWERDDTFHIEDGVQCERCHGPGSEYMDEETMRDPEAARAAGLQTPTKRLCFICHAGKGSHEAIHGQPPVDLDRGLQTIAHPRPENPQPAEPFVAGTLARGEERAYAGVMACAECHHGRDMGYQFSIWRGSSHFQAWARLASPEAGKFARQMGVQGDPQRSRICLQCHSTLRGDPAAPVRSSFDIDEGVGCEACHGAGSNYLDDAVMQDHERAVAAGLRKPDESGCRQCHDSAHGKPFDYGDAWEKVAHGKEPIHQTEVVRYKTPLNMALSPDGRFLWVAGEASGTVMVLDVEQRRKVAEISTGGQPTNVTFSPDGRHVYVSNRLDDTVSVVDARERRVLHNLAVGDEPHGVLTDPAGRFLYVLNTSEGSISVMDLAARREVKRLTASRSPWSLSLSPDGRRALVTNALPRFVKFREPSLSEVTVLDLERAVVEDRFEVPGANLLMGVDWHPDGDYGVITLNRTKNLVPMTRLLQGWTITNGLGIVWRDGRVDQVLLDQPDVSFPDPTDVAITPDGRLALVTSATTDLVAVVDLARLTSMIREASDHEREHILPNHLGKPTEFVIKHIPVGVSPRGILIAPDGATVYVAEALDDSVAVIDMEKLEVTATIDLGGPTEITTARHGEQLFHSARIAFHRQFSCHTCHPDGHVDGITYDIEPDGIGLGPVDNRSLRAVLDTAPFKWEGTNPTLRRQCGPRLAVFFTRVDPFTEEELDALEFYIATIPRPPNRYRGLDEPLTDAQRRGKKMFERAWTNDGRPIPLLGRCVSCHPPPLFTNHTVVRVGKRMWMDREENFDTPHLNNIYDSAPYLHNGIANTLEEIWTVYNPKDEHGVTNDMTKDQLNDLIEYIKTF